MPLPISPAPTTPTFLIAIPLLLIYEISYDPGWTIIDTKNNCIMVQSWKIDKAAVFYLTLNRRRIFL